MTSERRRSIAILTMTLVMGILLGLLVPGFFNKWEKRGRDGNRGREQQSYNNKKEWFVGTMNRILRPDSVQASKIQPIILRTAVEIDSLESLANQKMSAIMDSVKNRLKPILSPEQQERLDQFGTNAKKKWRGGGRQRPGGNPL